MKIRGVIMAETKRTTIDIDKSDFELYQKLMKTSYFQNNLHLFTCAVLIGKFIVKKPTAIKKRKDYIRVNDNRNNQNLVILKSLAISYNDSVNILTDENSLYAYCEKYARPGIKQIFEWYDDPNHDFGTTISKEMLKVFKNIDLDKLES